MVGDEQAVGLGCGAPDTAAQLVELGQAEVIGAFNQHDSGIGHIHTYLNNGGGN